MESSSAGKIGAEVVIQKLKDEGDFDKLRLKIVRKLKENEDLRNSIISTVKQSAAVNRPGAENLKPRQLSDAIHEEIGSKVMDQISDAVWEIIRSADGMKSEISDTVKSVYERLVNPKVDEVDKSSVPSDPISAGREAVNNGSLATSDCVMYDASPESEPKEPPGFSLCGHQQSQNFILEHRGEQQMPMPHERDGPKEEPMKESHDPQDAWEQNDDDDDLSVPPGFAPFVHCKPPCHGSDEDPDVPPGFG